MMKDTLNIRKKEVATNIYEIVYWHNFKFNSITLRHSNLTELTGLFVPLCIKGLGRVYVMSITDVTEPNEEAVSVYA